MKTKETFSNSKRKIVKLQRLIMIDTKEISKNSRRRKKYFSYYEKERYSVDFLVNTSHL